MCSIFFSYFQMHIFLLIFRLVTRDLNARIGSIFRQNATVANFTQKRTICVFLAFAWAFRLMFWALRLNVNLQICSEMLKKSSSMMRPSDLHSPMKTLPKKYLTSKSMWLLEKCILKTWTTWNLMYIFGGCLLNLRETNLVPMEGP